MVVSVCTKITVRSYVWSFGHSDPDPSNLGCLNIFSPCSALPLIINLNVSNLCGSYTCQNSSFGMYSISANRLHFQHSKFVPSNIIHINMVSMKKAKSFHVHLFFVFLFYYYQIHQTIEKSQVSVGSHNLIGSVFFYRFIF